MAEGRADLAVHSLKDVPMDMPEGFALAAIGAREDPRDALVSNHYLDLASLPGGARVGTSSLRREAQLRERDPLLAGRCRCAATSTPACASSTRAATTRSSSRPRD